MFLVPVEKDNPTTKTPWVVYVLIVVNSGLYLVSEFHYELDVILNTYGFIAGSPTLNAAFASIFLHASFIHIVGNMFFLWMYGDNVEEILGSGIFFFFYITLGLISVGAYYLFNSNSHIPLVGASGAISGVLGMYMVFFPHAHIDLHLQGKNTSVLIAHLSARNSVLFWLVSQLVLGLLFMNKAGGIAFSAHIGGLLAGIALGYYMILDPRFKPEVPNKVLCFEREKLSKIWCPHCGYEEQVREFRLYECPACGTQYKIVKSDSYKEPAKNYENNPIIDIASLENVSENIIPGNACHARLSYEQNGINLKLYGYLYKPIDKWKLLITIKSEEDHKIYMQEEFSEIIEIDEFLRLKTKFILSDFNQSTTMLKSNSSQTHSSSLCSELIAGD